MPTVGLEALLGVVRERQGGWSVNSYLIVVVDEDQATELLVTGETRSFVAYTFHQIAVTANGPRTVVNNVASEPGSEMSLSKGHPDSVRDALTKRAGSYFNPRGKSYFRMTRSE